MMDMMSGMGVMMLIGLIVLAIVIGVAVYLGVRATQTPQPRQLTAASACSIASPTVR